MIYSSRSLVKFGKISKICQNPQPVFAQRVKQKSLIKIDIGCPGTPNIMACILFINFC